MAEQTTNTFREDLPKLYGDWGVDSEIGKLRSVLMRRPGKEIENITREDSERLAFVMTDGDDYDPELVRKQHDEVARIYRENGVQVNYVEEMDESCPNAMSVSYTHLQGHHEAFQKRISELYKGSSDDFSRSVCFPGFQDDGGKYHFRGHGYP